MEIPKDDATETMENSEDADSQEELMSIENYRELNEQLTEVAMEAEKSIVQIMGIGQNENWVASQYTSSYQTTGLIVADNGPELLILTEYSDIRDAGLFRVVFADGTKHEAVMKQKDGNSNLAIFSVAKS